MNREARTSTAANPPPSETADPSAVSLPPEATPQVFVSLVGPLRIQTADGRSLLPRGRKARALFAYVSLARGGRVTRNHLAALLWDRSPEAQAKTSLRSALAELVAALAPHADALLDIDRDGIALRRAACRVDAFDLLDRLAGAEAADAEDLPEHCAERLLEDAFGLTSALDQWLIGERARFGDLVRRRLEEEMQRLLGEGAPPDRRAAAARRLLKFEPTHEAAVRVLMRAHADLDDRTQAIRAYERCLQALKVKLDIAPSRETVMLYEAIRRMSARPAGIAGAQEIPFQPVPGSASSGSPAFALEEGAGAHPFQGMSSAELARRPSIAVLPFVEYGVPTGETYFGDGIVEDIIGALASLPELFVISRNSTLQYRQGLLDVRAMGAALGVRYVLSGSVRRDRHRIRIAAELADTGSQVVLWSERIDGAADELFEVQDRLSARIIQTISPRVREAETRRALRKRPENLDAYDYFLRGLDLIYRLNRAEFEQAEAMFTRAAALDHGYAAPRAFAALWYSIRVDQGWSVDREHDIAAIDTLAAAALERDGRDIAALAVCGHLKALRARDFDTAFALFDRALAASPNSATAWIRSSPAFSYVGDGLEAQRRAEMAFSLSPLDPHLFFTQCALGLAAYTRGDYAAAAAWHRKSFMANPKFAANLRLLAASLAANGEIEEARRMGGLHSSMQPGFRVAPFAAGYAFREPERRALLGRHLTEAGLPA